MGPGQPSLRSGFRDDEGCGAAPMTAGEHSAPWLTIVGIGEDGLDGLGDDGASAPSLRPRSSSAAARHLALAADAITGEAAPWPTPFDPAMTDVLALRGRKVCVLASGDPFFHGVGATLARHRAARGNATSCPRPSAFSLAASRLGWALQEIETVSLHGRPARPHPAAAASGSAHPGADLGRRRPRRHRRPARRARLRRLAPDRPRSAGRPGRARPAGPAEDFDLDKHQSAQRAWRSTLNRRARRVSCR